MIGDKQSIDQYEAKLKDEIKKESKQILKNAKHKIDQEINLFITLKFQERIEIKVRRTPCQISTLDQLEEEIN